MGSEWFAELQKEKAAVEFIVQKIMQAYSIKLNYLLKRHELLLSIDHTFGNIPNNPNFYSSLRTYLGREKKLLDIVRGEDIELGNRIEYVLDMFKKTKGNTGIEAYGVKDSWGYENFINGMIKFVKHAISDISNIEKRMQVEGYFLQRRDTQSFNAFLKAWEQEMKANDRL